MGFWIADLPNLVFSSGGTTSNAITLVEDAYAVGVQTPTITASQVRVEVAMSSGSTSAFGVLQSGGADVVIAAQKSLVITPLPYRQLRLTSSTAAAATETHTVSKVFIV